MRSEFESREAFECIFGGEDGIDLSKDETSEYSFQPSRFAYSFFLVAWQYRQIKVDEITQLYAKELFNKKVVAKKASEKLAGLQLQNDELQKLVDAVKALIEEYRDPPTEDKTFQHALSIVAYELEQALKGGLDE